MTDCLLLNSLIRSVRNARTRSDPKGEEAKMNGSAARAQQQHTPTSAGTANEIAAKISNNAATDAKSDDGASILPSLLSDFRSDLVQLQDTVRRDLEELETLRLQNAVLREQLAERDRIIVSLQRQLRGEIG